MSHAPRSTYRIAIIGGGIAGLAAAYRLNSRLPLLGRPYDLKLYESSNRLGGVIQTLHRDGFILECGADSFLGDKRRGIAFCDELGFRRELITAQETNRRSFVSRGKKLIPVPKGFYLMGPTQLETFLLSSILSWKGKLRLLREPFVARHVFSDPLHDESVASFVRRRLGQEALERLAQPLAAGIYSADPETLSLRATFPQFLDMEQKGPGVLRSLLAKKDLATATASGARYGLFVTARQGMEALSRHIAQQLPPDVVKLQTTIRALTVRKEGSASIWTLAFENGDTVDADAVCLTLPAHACSYLLRTIDSTLSEMLAKIAYTDSITLNLAFKTSDIAHRMNGFGFVVPAVEKRFISACTFAHQKFEGRAPKDHALLRVFVGGNTLSRFMGDDTELERRSLADLKDLIGLRGKPLFSQISRYPRALPQYSLGHLTRLQDIKTRALAIPGLGLAGNWFKGVGIPDSIETAEDAVDTLWSYFSPK